MVLVEKQRLGTQVKKRYDVPKTPYQRVLEAPEIDPTTKQCLRQLYQAINPGSRCAKSGAGNGRSGS